MTWEEYTLTLTAEELGEVAIEAQELLTKALGAQKRVSKLMRYGGSEVMPGQSDDNAKRLRDEVLDVLICVRFLEKLGVIQPIRTHDVDMAVMERRAKILSNLRRSQDHGRLQEGECPVCFRGE